MQPLHTVGVPSTLNFLTEVPHFTEPCPQSILSTALKSSRALSLPSHHLAKTGAQRGWGWGQALWWLLRDEGRSLPLSAYPRELLCKRSLHMLSTHTSPAPPPLETSKSPGFSGSDSLPSQLYGFQMASAFCPPTFSQISHVGFMLLSTGPQEAPPASYWAGILQGLGRDPPGTGHPQASSCGLPHSCLPLLLKTWTPPRAPTALALLTVVRKVFLSLLGLTCWLWSCPLGLHRTKQIHVPPAFSALN